MIDRNHDLSITRQAELLDISRGSVYYLPRPTSAANLALMLANLQRHSDHHHLRALTPYPQLQALPGPQLPTGYAGCVLMAAVPPLWFGVMERRLRAVAPRREAIASR